MPASIKSTNFQGQKFYIGIDVHRKSWSVTIRSLNIELAHFNQPPSVEPLINYLSCRYPGGRFFSTYEAGFCGTSYHHALCNSGIQNIIIHPADLPQSDKQKKTKTDLHDSRSLARYLEAGVLHGIHIMPDDQQQRRALFRCREAKIADVTRCINRLRSLLYYTGTEVPDEFKEKEYISQNFLNWLSELNFSTVEGTETLRHYVEDLRYQRAQLLFITRRLKKAITEHYYQYYSSLITVPGIGPITAIALLAETGDLKRFNNPDEYCSYLGLIPAEHSSGDTIYSNRIQPRCNRHLRPLFIEAAWTAIRRCPYFLSYYKQHVGKNNKKVIVKVARKLALVAKAVAVGQTIYKPGYYMEHKLSGAYK